MKKKRLRNFKEEKINVGKKAIKAYPLTEENLDNFDYQTVLKNPHIRPLTVLINKGAPPGTVHYLYILYNTEKYLIGTLVFTRGDRVLFFPGMNDLIYFNDEKNPIGEVDHITCDRSLKEGHFKFYDRVKKVYDIKLPEIYKSCYHWFGFALKHPNILFPAKKYTYLIKPPKSDMYRRLKEFNKCSRPGITFGLHKYKIKRKRYITINFHILKGNKIDNKEFKTHIPFGKIENKQVPCLTGSIKHKSGRYMVFMTLCVLKTNKKKIFRHTDALIYKIFP